MGLIIAGYFQLQCAIFNELFYYMYNHSPTTMQALVTITIIK